MSVDRIAAEWAARDRNPVAAMTTLPEGFSMTIVPQPWISVEERLPEDRVNVLTCGDDPVDGPFILIGRREPGSKFGPPHWHLPCFAFGPVTHWMPLPEPPKCATH